MEVSVLKLCEPRACHTEAQQTDQSSPKMRTCEYPDGDRNRNETDPHNVEQGHMGLVGYVEDLDAPENDESTQNEKGKEYEETFHLCLLSFAER